MFRRFRQLEAWEWNSYITAFAILVVFSAFSFVIPFLSLFLSRELGMTDMPTVALWTGILFATAPLLGAFSGPIWGSLADRFGHKAMLQRAIFVVSIALGAMAFAQNEWHVLFWRAVIGLFGGINAMGIALLTTIAPKEKTGQAVGLLYGARALSGAVAPALGGALADSVGMRQAFIVSGLLGFASFALLTAVFRETPDMKRDRETRRQAPPPMSLRAVARSPEFLALALVLFFVQAVDNSFAPILPLFVAMLEGSAERAASLSGMIISVAAVAMAIASTGLGRLTERLPARRLLLVTLVLGTLLCIPLALSGSTTEFFIWRVLLGLCAGGTMTLAFSLGGSVIPPEIRGAGFGLLTSATLMGSAVSPIVFGALGGYNLRYAFGLDAIVYAVIFVWVLVALRHNR
ncbi:MAG: MFS transporter [Chloroflexi bacterium]|nr:MFS transporter [Chloroflexota bacterium]